MRDARLTLGLKEVQPALTLRHIVGIVLEVVVEAFAGGAKRTYMEHVLDVWWFALTYIISFTRRRPLSVVQPSPENNVHRRTSFP